MPSAEPKIQDAEWHKAAGQALYRATKLLQQSQADELELIEGHIQEALRAVQTMKALRKMVQIDSDHPGLIDKFIGRAGAMGAIDLRKAVEEARPPTRISLMDAKLMIDTATLQSAFKGLDARVFNRHLLDAAGNPETFDPSDPPQVLSAARKRAKELGLPRPTMDDASVFCAHQMHIFFFGDFPNSPKIQHAPGHALGDEDGNDDAAGQRPSAK